MSLDRLHEETRRRNIFRFSPGWTVDHPAKVNSCRIWTSINGRNDFSGLQGFGDVRVPVGTKLPWALFPPLSTGASLTPTSGLGCTCLFSNGCTCITVACLPWQWVQGFFLVTLPRLMASSQARKAQPLFHYKVKTFLVRHFGKARTVGPIMGLTAERTVLLRRIGWVCDTTMGSGYILHWNRRILVRWIRRILVREGDKTLLFSARTIALGFRPLVLAVLLFLC